MLGDIKQAEDFEALPRALRRIVFYSEGPADWPHLSGLVDNLIDHHKFPIAYLASDPRDPGLRRQSPLLRSFQIGTGGVRANLFSKLSADIMVLTTPDLGNLSLKRSPNCARYVYVFHSPVSTHMIYRSCAFDHYDTIFCVGPHHDAEIRRHEVLNECRHKELVPFGYSRLDAILNAQQGAQTSKNAEPLSVVLAPSWGPSGVFETIGVNVVKILLDAGFKVIARPHPQTRLLTPNAIGQLEERFCSEARFKLDENIAGSEALLTADVLISDWSGAALDYAFGRLKPVIFIDTPPKVNNANYEDLNIEPIEVSIRSKIGSIIGLDTLNDLPQLVTETAKNSHTYAESISRERYRAIYNLGGSGLVGSNHLLKMLQSMTDPQMSGIKDFGSRLSEKVRGLLKDYKTVESDPACFDVMRFICDLFVSQKAFDPTELNRLETLCRKIDVAGRVWTRYDQSLSRALERLELPSAGIQALSILWLRAATAVHSEDPGLALKFVNSAGRYIDRLAESDGAVRFDYFDHLISTTFDAVRHSK